VRFASLGSGSRGNATLVEAAGTRVLVDCGFPLRELERRLQGLGVCVTTLDAVLVTHEHADHVRGLGALARSRRLPVWMTAGTRYQGRFGHLPRLQLFSSHESAFRVGGISVQPFAVPHDAREPAQFVFTAGRYRFGILTDAGSVTPHIQQSLRGCDALLLECNHDPVMLREGPYPPRLQARVGGRLGHLSNQQAASLLSSLEPERMRIVVAAHLSEKNNTPALARQVLLDSCPGLEGQIALATQHQASDWFDL
jgi:phosphoribosyl 1,2-cyclic phosphodiesterase